jgi:hypothetical protein
VKRKISKREFEKRERCKIKSNFDGLFSIREREEKWIRISAVNY